MNNGFENKKGFTLIEVLAVVVLIGILSALAFSSLSDLIAKNRTKDAAVNAAAFMNRVAMEAKRLDTPLCLIISTDKKRLEAYKCSEDKMDIEGNFLYDTYIGSGFTAAMPTGDWNSGIITFTPKIGLSSVDGVGILTLRYTRPRFCGAAEKTQDVNLVVPKLSIDDCSTFGDI